MRDQVANGEFVGIHDFEDMSEELWTGAQSGDVRVTIYLLD